MKILLIYPPTTRPKSFSSSTVRVSAFFPLGLSYIAGTLIAAGHNVKILDALVLAETDNPSVINNGTEYRYGLDDSDIENEIKQFNPEIVGISCLFAPQQKDTENVSRLVKKVDQKIVTVIGGHHAAASAKRIMDKCQEIDFVVDGEGELAFLDIIAHLKGEKHVIYPNQMSVSVGIPRGQVIQEIDLENGNLLDGVTWRNNGKVVTIPKTRYIEDLDRIPRPPYDNFDMNAYFEKAKSHGFGGDSKFTQMVTTRGCPCKCTFCTLAALPGMPRSVVQRQRSVEHVLNELEFLVKTYNVEEVHFEDDNLTADRKWAEKLFDGIVERGIKIGWHVPSGIAAYSLDDNLLDKMKLSGCNSITIAIESGDEHVLKNLMHKPMRLDTIPGLVKKIRDIEIDVRAFFLLGFPGETKETMNKTVDYARNLELDWAYFTVTFPLPGTRIYDDCISKGYINEEEIDNLFVFGFNRAVINTPEFDAEYVEELKERAIVDINFKNNVNLIKYDVDKAIAEFKAVLKNYPHFDFANYYLAEAYKKKGDIFNAMKYYKNTIKYNPDHTEAVEKLAALDLRNNNI